MSAAVPVYFEESWAILSSIGLLNILLGFMVLGITNFSPIWLVPVITSAAGAVANGLCYYAFYADYAVLNTAVASAFADTAWLVQEAGASFYSYVILSRVLRHRSRTVFQAIFWTMMLTISCIRAVILVTRIRFILSTAGTGDLNGVATSAGDTRLQSLVDNLHVGYFSSIALVEVASAFFLLREFSTARRISVRAAIKTGLFSYLMRSTEIRVALLAVVGITRAITYSFQNSAQSATNTASQVDRFAYTLECVFPIVMLIDMLASRVVFAGNTGDRPSERSRSYGQGTARRGGGGGNGGAGSGGKNFGMVGSRNGDVDMDAYPYPAGSNGRSESKVQGGGGSATITKLSSDKASSQEFIIDGAKVRRASSDCDGDLGMVVSVERGDPHRGGGGHHGGLGSFGGINKTVEFEVYEGRKSPRSPV